MTVLILTGRRMLTAVWRSAAAATVSIGLTAVGVALLSGCGRTAERPQDDGAFTVEVMNGYTPVKTQGHSTLCWAYAMLAAIETEHIMRGDSVHLSVKYAARALLDDNFVRAYLSAGRTKMRTRGTAQTLLNIMERHGMVAYDAYRDDGDVDISVLNNKVRRIARTAVNTKAGLRRFRKTADEVMDETLGPAPKRVFMLGAEYTPGEFARSVCAPDEYMALTSFTHHPFYNSFALEVPDNWEMSRMFNVPVDTLMARMERAVRRGHGVCWEGDTSERGFSFARGTADIPPGTALTQEARQKAFERFETTDDHCMAIVGLAHDASGRLFYVMKNSWGTDNPYGGLMYLSADYVRMKTVAVFMTRRAFHGDE